MVRVIGSYLFWEFADGGFIELLEVLIAKKGSLSQSEIEEAIKRRQEIGTPRSPRVFTSKEFIDKSDDGLE